MKVCLVTARIPPVHCGVGDYTAQLAAELERQGHDVSILTAAAQAAALPGTRVRVRNTIRSWKLARVPRLLRELRALAPELVVVQWVPFLYSRTGTALGLPVAMLAFALRGRGRVRVMVHEPWVAFDRPWFVAIGLLHRLALGLLVAASERVLVSISIWTELLRRRFPWRRDAIAWVPVGSNIPVAATPDAPALRDSLGIARSALLLGSFGAGGANKALPLLVAGWREVRKALPQAELLLIGTSAEELRRIMPGLASDPRCHVTGYLSPADVSRWLQTTDVLISPFVDGISTRRGSAIAGLAHGVPVVTTTGHLTDVLFHEPGSPVVLAPLEEERFAETLLHVVRDGTRLKALRRRSAQFCAGHFAWDRIAARVMEAVPAEHPAAAG